MNVWYVRVCLVAVGTEEYLAAVAQCLPLPPPPPPPPPPPLAFLVRPPWMAVVVLIERFLSFSPAVSLTVATQLTTLHIAPHRRPRSLSSSSSCSRLAVFGSRRSKQWQSRESSTSTSTSMGVVVSVSL